MNLRIMSQANYPNRLPMHLVVQGLQEAMQHPMRVFWADDIQPLDASGIDWQQVLRPGLKAAPMRVNTSSTTTGPSCWTRC